MLPLLPAPGSAHKAAVHAGEWLGNSQGRFMGGTGGEKALVPAPAREAAFGQREPLARA